MKKKERRGIHLIAELANVSIGTVDRALHGRGGIKEATRHRILQVASQIGYTPNLAARALVGGPGQQLPLASVCRGKSTSSTTNCGAEFWTKPGAWPSWVSNLSIARCRCWENSDTEAF